MRFVGVRVVMPLGVLAALLLVSGESRAESHLFSAHANRPGVTIVGASRNGMNLPVAGQQGAATFFRIDVPNGPVPCQNDLSFMASTGQRVEMSVDLCAANYEVAVAVAGGGNAAPQPMPAPAPPAQSPATQSPATQSPAPAAPARTSSSRSPPTIRTSPSRSLHQPARKCRSTSEPIPTSRSRCPPAAAAMGCSQDIGLALSDGRRIARLVDVCQTNFVAVIALAGGPSPSAPPPSLMPVVNAPPVAEAEPAPAAAGNDRRARTDAGHVVRPSPRRSRPTSTTCSGCSPRRARAVR